MGQGAEGRVGRRPGAVRSDEVPWIRAEAVDVFPGRREGPENLGRGGGRVERSAVRVLREADRRVEDRSCDRGGGLEGEGRPVAELGELRGARSLGVLHPGPVQVRGSPELGVELRGGQVVAVGRRGRIVQAGQESPEPAGVRERQGQGDRELGQGRGGAGRSDPEPDPRFPVDERDPRAPVGDRAPRKRREGGIVGHGRRDPGGNRQHRRQEQREERCGPPAPRGHDEPAPSYADTPAGADTGSPGGLPGGPAGDAAPGGDDPSPIPLNTSPGSGRTGRIPGGGRRVRSPRPAFTDSRFMVVLDSHRSVLDVVHGGPLA